jgi:hypothetical protein
VSKEESDDRTAQAPHRWRRMMVMDELTLGEANNA